MCSLSIGYSQFRLTPRVALELRLPRPEGGGHAGTFQVREEEVAGGSFECSTRRRKLHVRKNPYCPWLAHPGHRHGRGDAPAGSNLPGARVAYGPGGNRSHVGAMLTLRFVLRLLSESSNLVGLPFTSDRAREHQPAGSSSAIVRTSGRTRNVCSRGSEDCGSVFDAGRLRSIRLELYLLSEPPLILGVQTIGMAR